MKEVDMKEGGCEGGWIGRRVHRKEGAYEQMKL